MTARAGAEKVGTEWRNDGTPPVPVTAHAHAESDVTGLSTDLSDLASDISTLQSASHAAATVLDSSSIDLGITGQQITAAIIDSYVQALIDATNPMSTKGDLLTRSASALVRQPVGSTDGKVLAADSTTSTGLRWAAPTGGVGSGAAVADPPYPVSHYQKTPGATTCTVVGSLPTWACTGTAANTDDATGPWMKQSTSGTDGNASGAGASTFSVFRRDWGTVLQMYVRPIDVASVRIWCGCWASAPSAADRPTVHLASFRYSTGFPDTFWTAVTNDGGAVPTETPSAVTPANGTPVRLEIQLLASSVDFYINGALVASHATDLPSATQIMGIQCYITNITGTAKAIEIQSMDVWMRGR